MRQLSLLPLSAHARLPAHAGDFVAPYDIDFGEAGKSGAQMEEIDGGAHPRPRCRQGYRSGGTAYRARAVVEPHLVGALREAVDAAADDADRCQRIDDTQGISARLPLRLKGSPQPTGSRRGYIGSSLLALRWRFLLPLAISRPQLRRVAVGSCRVGAPQTNSARSTSGGRPG